MVFDRILRPASDTSRTSMVTLFIIAAGFGMAQSGSGETNNQAYLPGRSFAISVHLLPRRLCACKMARSSSADQGSRLIDGSNWFMKRSRHCLPVRPVASCPAMTAHFPPPWTVTSCLIRSSSCKMERSDEKGVPAVNLIRHLMCDYTVGHHNVPHQVHAGEGTREHNFLGPLTSVVQGVRLRSRPSSSACSSSPEPATDKSTTFSTGICRRPAST